MKILIGTKNPTKIEGAKRAFGHYFEDFEIEGVSVNSEVSDEPLNNEIYLGATNRIKGLIKYAKENDIHADYYIAIESGITNLLGDWLLLNIATIEDNNGNKSIGSSAGFPVAEKYLDEIINTDLGKVMDKIFNEDDLRSRKGGISILTRDVISRYDQTEDAFVMALTKFINGDLCK